MNYQDYVNYSFISCCSFQLWRLTFYFRTSNEVILNSFYSITEWYGSEVASFMSYNIQAFLQLHRTMFEIQLVW
jgi:hypothetical protein